ncbi:hypothetical protein JCM9279_004314 [Rhodotorula babjevae]
MALDLSDPSLRAAYEDLLRPEGATDWLVLGYSTSTQLSLAARGTRGLEELRDHLVPSQVLFGLLSVEGKVLLWSQIPHSVGGVKRARALVHERTVADTLRGYTATLSVSSRAELDPSAVAIRLFHQPHLSTSRSGTASPPISPHLPTSTSRQHSSTAGSVRRPSVPESTLSGHGQKPSSPRRTTGASAAFAPTPPATRYEGASAAAAQPEASTRRSLEQHNLSPGYPSHLASASLGSRNGHAVERDAPPPRSHATPLYDSFASSASRPDPTVPHREIRPSSASPPVSPGLLPVSQNAGGIFESAAAAMLVASASDPSLAGHALSAQGVPVDVAEDDVSVARAPPPEPSSAEGTVDAHGGEHELEQRTRALELEGREDAARLERERRERAAEEAAAHARREEEERVQRDGEEARRRQLEEEEHARLAAEDEARARLSAEEEYRRQAEAELERERVAEEERRAAAEEEAAQRARDDERRRIEEEEELARREEDLRRAEEERVLHEHRVAEERRLAEEAERARVEEEERTRRAEEEMRLLIERQRAEKQLREQEEARLREEERVRAVEVRRSRLVQQRDAGEVMLAGTVNVQGGGSMLWKRRYFRLTSSRLDFFKSETDADTPVDSLAVADVERLTSNPEEALVPHAFKATLKDGDERLFYYLSAVETETLVEALQCALRR